MIVLGGGLGWRPVGSVGGLYFESTCHDMMPSYPPGYERKGFQQECFVSVFATDPSPF